MNAVALLYLASVGGVILLRGRRWTPALVAAQSASAVAVLLLGDSLDSIGTYLALADLVFFRMLLLPWILGRELRRSENSGPDPSSLARWGTALVAFLLLVSALHLGHRIEPEDPARGHLLGAAVTGVLGGLLLLASSGEPAGQIVALLTFESGIVLFERLASHDHEGYLQPLFTLLFVWSIALYRLFLRRLGPDGEPRGSRLPEIVEGEVM